MTIFCIALLTYLPYNNNALNQQPVVEARSAVAVKHGFVATQNDLGILPIL